MRTVVHLESGDLKRIKLSVREICNRLVRPSYFTPKGHKSGEPSGTYVESFAGFHRRDMFWVDISYEDQDLGSVSIEPNLQDPSEFNVSKNWCNVEEGYEKLVDKIVRWFKGRPEYHQQVEWTTKLAKLIKRDEANNFKTTFVSPEWGYKIPESDPDKEDDYVPKAV